jgi:hypothetical protein
LNWYRVGPLCCARSCSRRRFRSSLSRCCSSTRQLQERTEERDYARELAAAGTEPAVETDIETVPEFDRLAEIENAIDWLIEQGFRSEGFDLTAAQTEAMGTAIAELRIALDRVRTLIEQAYPTEPEAEPEPPQRDDEAAPQPDKPDRFRMVADALAEGLGGKVVDEQAATSLLTKDWQLVAGDDNRWTMVGRHHVYEVFDDHGFTFRFKLPEANRWTKSPYHYLDAERAKQAAEEHDGRTYEP